MFTNVNRSANGYVLVGPYNSQTNIKGIFAAGSVVYNSTKTAINAVTSGYTASEEVSRFLNY